MMSTVRTRLGAVALAATMLVGTLGGSVAVAPPTEAQTIRVVQKAENHLGRRLNQIRKNQLNKNELKRKAFIRKQARQNSRRFMRNPNSDPHAGFKTRMERIQRNITSVQRGCENVAWANGYTNRKEVVRIFINGWRNSEGHRKCMFSQLGWRGRLYGVGIVRQGDKWVGTLIVTD